MGNRKKKKTSAEKKIEYEAFATAWTESRRNPVSKE